MRRLWLTHRLAFGLAIGAGFSMCVEVRGTPFPSTKISSSVVNPAIAELFDQLADDDPQQREDASQRLLNYGPLIRPAVLDLAQHAELPEVRARAARILWLIPWTRADDPVPVQQALGEYRSSDSEARIIAAAHLASLKVAPAFAALIRLLHEEPSADVRWAIAQQLHRLSADPSTAELVRQQLQQLDTTGNDPAVLAAVGWAWQRSDPAKAMALLQQAVETDALDPADDQGELELIISALYLDSINHGQFDNAAEMARRRVWRCGEPISEAILELFTVHAQYGPRQGFANDMKVFRPYFDSPELMYILAQMYTRQNEPKLAGDFKESARVMGQATPQAHKRIAEFLMARQWWEFARNEFNAAMGAQPATDLDPDLYWGLANCAGGLGKDGEAGKMLQTLLDRVRQIPARNLELEQRIDAEMQWRYLRDARDHNRSEEMVKCLDRLSRWVDRGEGLFTTNPDMGIDIITALKTAKRDKEAAKLFEAFYVMFKQQLDAEPQNPQALNNIAWLCARCDERADEAMRWSAAALRLAPGNAAYLDTAAEAAARNGKWALAVEYESAALRLEPGEHFMTAQLARFREGLAKSQKR